MIEMEIIMNLKMLRLLFTLLPLFLFCFHSTAYSYDKNAMKQLRRSNKCKNCNLYRANFSQKDLTGANLKGSNLMYANFRKATLYRVNFEGANLYGANFEGALWINGQYICQKGSIGFCLEPSSWKNSDKK